MTIKNLLYTGLVLCLCSSTTFADATPKQLKCIATTAGAASNTIVLTQTNSSASPNATQSYTASGTIMLSPVSKSMGNTGQPVPVNLGCFPPAATAQGAATK